MTEQQSNGQIETRADIDRRHALACAAPRPGYEKAIVCLMDGVREYVRAYRREWDNDLADDGVSGPAIAGILASVYALLNCECGRLDGGRLWGELDTIAKDAGWEDLEHARSEVQQ